MAKLFKCGIAPNSKIAATILGAASEQITITSLDDGLVFNVSTNNEGRALLVLPKGNYSAYGNVSKQTFSSKLTKDNPYVYARPTDIVYWYGATNPDIPLQVMNSGNGWSVIASGYSFGGTATFNTNNFYVYGGSSQCTGIGTSVPIPDSYVQKYSKITIYLTTNNSQTGLWYGDVKHCGFVSNPTGRITYENKSYYVGATGWSGRNTTCHEIYFSN